MNAADPAPTYLTFGAMLDALNYDGSDLLQCSHIEPGKHLSPVNPRLASWYWDNDSVPWSDGDWYFGICPINPDLPLTKRQTADHAHAMRVLVADLDHKPGGCVDAAGSAIVTNLLAAALYTRPTVVVSTGHGIAPYWPADPDDDDWGKLTTTDITALYRRFGRLVAKLASIAGYHVDNIFDAARVMRIPGSMNWKDPDHLVECVATLDTGAPVTLAALLGALDEYGIDEVPSDRDLSSLGNDVLAAPSSWPEGLPEPCPYVTAMIAKWRTEPADRVKGERNTTLFLRAMRLAAARRRGCLSAATLAPLWAEVGATFLQALTHAPVRAPRRGEIEATWANAVNRVARMTAEQLGKEIGHHLHPGDPDPLTGTVGTPGTAFTASASAASTTSAVTATPGVSTDSTAPAILPVGANRPAAWLDERITHSDVADWVVNTGVLADWRWSKGLKWAHWVDTHWRVEDDDLDAAAVPIRIAIAAAIAAEIASLTASKTRINELSKTLDLPFLLGVARICSRHPRIVVDASVFDSHAHLIPFKNGTYDARTRELRPPQREDMITKILNANYDPAARDDAWDAITTGPNAMLPPDVMDWVQERLGSALLGRPAPDDYGIYFRGSGANGKSTLLGPVEKVFGPLGVSVDESLLMPRDGSHTTEMTELRGARFALVEEAQDKRELSGKRLKDLLGTNTMKGRRMHSNQMTWTATHSLFLTSNHELRISDTDDAVWRRLWRVEFPYTYVLNRAPRPGTHERQGDVGVRDRLLSGVANDAVAAWLVRGLEKAMSREGTPGCVRFGPVPQSVQEVTRQWRKDVNEYEQFWENWIVEDPGWAIVATDLYEAFRRVTGKHKGRGGIGDVTLRSRFIEMPVIRTRGIKIGRGPYGIGGLHLDEFPAALVTIYAEQTLTQQQRDNRPARATRPPTWEGIRFRRTDEFASQQELDAALQQARRHIESAFGATTEVVDTQSELPGS